MTVQDIVDAVSNDIRKVLSNSGADATLMIGWVDRIHKDILHTSFLNSLNQGSTTVTTTAGTSSYTLTPTDIRRVLLVYDRTFNREILPLDSLSQPVAAGEQVQPAVGSVQDTLPRSILSDRTRALWPEYYKYLGTVTFVLFPAPVSATYAGTIEIYYEKEVANLTTLATTLVVDDDGKDMVVAGVNWLANSYLKRAEEASQWVAVYEKMKRGELIV